jgi:hypothetical protein
MKITEHSMQSAFYYQNDKHTYKVEFIEIPAGSGTHYDFVWNALNVEKEIIHTIETWGEPMCENVLGIVVCLINLIAESPRLLLKSYIITVVVGSTK